jgi:hypothetical protein
MVGVGLAVVVWAAGKPVQSGRDRRHRGSHAVQVATYLRKATIDLAAELANLGPQVGLVLVERVHGADCGLPKLPDLGTNFGYVTVSATGQNASSNSVLPGLLHVFFDLLHALFKVGDTSAHVVVSHGGSVLLS